MTLTKAEEKVLIQLVVLACRSVLRRNEFRQAVQASWLSIDDIQTIYYKTLRSIENRSQIDSWPKYARFVARKEATRFYNEQLEEQRERNEVSFDEMSHSGHRIDGGRGTPDSAEVAEQRDLAEKLRRLIDQLPSEQQQLLCAFATCRHGDNAIELEADKLGLARSTAYKLFRASLNQLQKQFPELES